MKKLFMHLCAVAALCGSMNVWAQDSTSADERVSAGKTSGVMSRARNKANAVTEYAIDRPFAIPQYVGTGLYGVNALDNLRKDKSPLATRKIAKLFGRGEQFETWYSKRNKFVKALVALADVIGFDTALKLMLGTVGGLVSGGKAWYGADNGKGLEKAKKDFGKGWDSSGSTIAGGIYRGGSAAVGGLLRGFKGLLPKKHTDGNGVGDTTTPDTATGM